MRLRVYLSILFIIAITFTALHELDHIGAHDSSKCIVCHVNNHTSAPDIIQEITEQAIYSYKQVSSTIIEFLESKNLSLDKIKAP